MYCQPGEYCTVIDGVQGCCPEGSTCSSKKQCSDLTSARCTGENKDPLCCTEELPFCNTETSTCVAVKPELGPAPTVTKTTQLAITLAPSPTLLPATPAPQPVEQKQDEEVSPQELGGVDRDVALEIEADQNVADDIGAEKEVEEEVKVEKETEKEAEKEIAKEVEVEDDEEEVITRTQTNTATSTISIPVCGAQATGVLGVPEKEEPICETYTYTKVIPSTIWVPAPTPIKPTVSAAPSVSRNATASIIMQTPKPSTPAQFTGAASTVKGGVFGVVVAAVAGLLML